MTETEDSEPGRVSENKQLQHTSNHKACWQPEIMLGALALVGWEKTVALPGESTASGIPPLSGMAARKGAGSGEGIANGFANCSDQDRRL